MSNFSGTVNQSSAGWERLDHMTSTLFFYVNNTDIQKGEADRGLESLGHMT